MLQPNSISRTSKQKKKKKKINFDRKILFCKVYRATDLAHVVHRHISGQ